MTIQEQVKSEYAAMILAITNNNAVVAKALAKKIGTIVRESESKSKELANVYWQKRNAEDEEGAAQVYADMDGLIVASYSETDPLAVGAVKGIRIKDTGVILVSSFRSSDRYLFDFQVCKHDEGWLQYDTDQDAHYYGVWVHKERRIIVSYCEGDIYVSYCLSDDIFNAEIEEMNKFNGEGYEFKTIGDEGITEYRQDRSQFSIH